MTYGVNDLRIKVFADGADRKGIVDLCRNPLIRGFTTNPTLMRAAGVTDYEAFARDILEVEGSKPISFEVLCDEFDEMARQARKIAGWGPNVFVKIPVTNTRGETCFELLRRLSGDGLQLNVTALMTSKQVELVSAAMADGAPGYVSVFAGRIADTGRDPVPIMLDAVETLSPYPHLELIWASPREVLNLFQADAVGCDVITMTHDLLRKLGSVGKDLDDFSLETVRMFYNDAEAAGYSL
jgi:transaldolase